MNSQYASINVIKNGTALIASGNVAVPLSATPQGCLQVIVTALDTNVGPVYLGGVGIAAKTGIQLEPTNSTPIPIFINDLSKLFIIGENVNDGVSFSCFN